MRRAKDPKFISKNYQLIFHLSINPFWNSRGYNGLSNRILAFLFLPSAKYILSDPNPWTNLLHLFSRYVFKGFFPDYLFFHERNWATVKNIFNKAIRMVAMTITIRTASIFKCLPVGQHRAKHLRWNFSLILTASSFDQII